MPAREQGAEPTAPVDLHRAVFDGLGHGVVVISSDGWILDANAAHLAQVRRTREELVGRYSPVYAHPEDVEALYPLITDLFTGERDEVRTAYRFVDGAGRTRRCRITARIAPVAPDDHVLVVAYDPDDEPAEALDEALAVETTPLHMFFGAATYVVHDLDGRIARPSSGAGALLGRTADELLGQRWTDGRLGAVLPGGRRLPPDEDPVARAAVTGTAALDTVGLRLPDGDLVWVSMSCTLAPFRGGKAVITSLTDVTEVVRAHEDRGRLAGIVELTTDLVASFHLDGTCRWLNASAARALQADPLAPGDVGLAQLVDAHTLTRFEDVILPAVRRDGIWTGEVDLSLAGRRLPMAANVIADLGPRDHLDGWTLIGHDLTDHKALQAELAHLATHDELTGIPNRALLAERLDRADAGGEDLSVAFLDLDGFKAVNDTHGHHVGDLALIEVARRLAGAVGPASFVARFGGDEFVVLADPSWADPEATLARALAEPVVVGGLHLALRAGIGVAHRRAGEPARDVVARADQAMYRGKAARRNPLHGALVSRPALAVPAVDQVSS